MYDIFLLNYKNGRMAVFGMRIPLNFSWQTTIIVCYNNNIQYKTMHLLSVDYSNAELKTHQHMHDASLVVPAS